MPMDQEDCSVGKAKDNCKGAYPPLRGKTGQKRRSVIIKTRSFLGAKSYFYFPHTFSHLCYFNYHFVSFFPPMIICPVLTIVPTYYDLFLVFDKLFHLTLADEVVIFTLQYTYMKEIYISGRG